MLETFNPLISLSTYFLSRNLYKRSFRQGQTNGYLVAMEKKTCIAVLITTIVLISLISGAVDVNGQSGTQVSGILVKDTTWTKAQSPYSLTGPVGVSTGVRLTVEAGTVINCNGFFIAVNGTLNVKGIVSDSVVFNNVGGDYPYYGITFTELSDPSSVIENSIITPAQYAYYTIYINNSYTKLSNNTITGTIDIEKGSSLIDNNKISGSISAHGSPQVVNNNIISTISGIQNQGDDATIISNNVITGAGQGYGIGGGHATVSGNIISNFETGISKVYGTIQRNLVTACYFGIDAEASGRIQNNTITNNVEGIFFGAWNPAIEYNNLQNNTHNLYLNAYANGNITAPNNWWGTTDPQAIKQTIHDNREGFDVFTAAYEPVLTEPNAQAPPIPSWPSESPSPSPTLTVSPTASESESPTSSPIPAGTSPPPQVTLQPIPAWFYAIIVGLLTVIVVLLCVIIVQRRKISGVAI